MISLPGCSVSIARVYRLEGRGILVRFSAGARDFSVLHSVHTGSGDHPASYRVGAGALYPGVKRPGREADHSPSPSDEVENGGSIPPLPNVSSWRDA
jgi:hypothetical protein